jgi:hypothetical protein
MHMRRSSQLSTILKIDGNITILGKPYLNVYNNDPNFLEKGQFTYDRDGKKITGDMFHMPIICHITLSKVDENKTLQTDLIIVNPCGWLNSKKLRDATVKTTLQTLAKDLYNKYEALTKTKFPKDSKLEDFKEYMLGNPIGQTMYNALYGDSNY